MAQALGAKLLTAEGQQIASGGGALETLHENHIYHLDVKPENSIRGWQIAGLMLPATSPTR